MRLNELESLRAIGRDFGLSEGEILESIRYWKELRRASKTRGFVPISRMLSKKTQQGLSMLNDWLWDVLNGEYEDDDE